ncbi:MAG: MFS transporter [Gammaproteobacteria bacterium]|jgi:MFS transporter, DHA1 family, staphyloferrin A biosynthesis exporter|nr:MFS transporter [Gammaproteobacteria bacterium]
MSNRVPDQNGASQSVASVPKRGTFASLAIPNYRFVWISSLFASFAMQMQSVARGWLIYDMTASAMALAWVMLSFSLPTIFFSLVGGVMADRMDKKKVIIAAQLSNALFTCVLAWEIYQGDVTFWHFILFGFINGSLLALSMPARAALVPEVVGEHNLVNASALQSATFNLSRVLGPAFAGLLIAGFAGENQASTTGVGLVFFILSAFYLVAAFAMFFLKLDFVPTAGEYRTPLADIREGISYTLDDRIVFGLLIMSLIPFSFGFSASFLLPAFNQSILGGGPEDLGLLMSCMGGGALAGSMTLARAGDFRRKGEVMFKASYLWAFSIGLLAISQDFLTALVTCAITGYFSAIFGSLNGSVLQLAVNAEIRGRVMSIYMMTFGLVPLGVMPVSIIAENLGIDLSLIAAAVMLGLSMFLLSVLMPDLRKIDRGW